MGTFLTIVFFIVVVLIISRTVDKKEEKQKLKTFNNKVQDLKDKYHTLLSGIIPSGLDVKLVTERPRELVYELNTGSGVTIVTLYKKGQQLNISWKFTHIIYGSHFKEWSFAADGSQNEMLDTIFQDLDEINKRFK